MCVIRSNSTGVRTKISSQVTFKMNVAFHDIQKKEKKKGSSTKNGPQQNTVSVGLTEPLHSSPIAVWMIWFLLIFTAS